GIRLRSRGSARESDPAVLDAAHSRPVPPGRPRHHGLHDDRVPGADPGGADSGHRAGIDAVVPTLIKPQLSRLNAPGLEQVEIETSDLRLEGCPGLRILAQQRVEIKLHVLGW